MEENNNVVLTDQDAINAYLEVEELDNKISTLEAQKKAKEEALTKYVETYFQNNPLENSYSSPVYENGSFYIKRSFSTKQSVDTKKILADKKAVKLTLDAIKRGDIPLKLTLKNLKIYDNAGLDSTAFTSVEATPKYEYGVNKNTDETQETL